MVTDAMIAAARDEFIAVVHGFYYPSNEQIRCVLEATEKAAWMPISEAPKDGTEILAFAQSSELLGRKFIGVAQWAEASDWLPGSVAGWFWPYAIRPTHFRFLPTPPEASPD